MKERSRMAEQSVIPEKASSLKKPPATKKACPQTVMDQESALLRGLEATTTFRLFNEALELYGQGKRLARFEKQEDRK